MDANAKRSPDRAKFAALAEKRMNRAIKAIRAVGELDRKRLLIDYTDAAMMTRALSEECSLACQRLQAAARGEPTFTLERPIVAGGQQIMVGPGGVSEI